MILGQLFALLTAMCWAQNSVVYSMAGKRVGSSVVTHIRLWVALPAMLLINLLFTGSFLPQNLESGSILYLSISGFAGFCLADLFIFRAFVDIGHRETLVIMTMSPLFSAVISWFLLDEILSPLQITGILLTIAGVAWVVLVENRDPGNADKVKRKGVVFAVLGAFGQAIGMAFAKIGMGANVHPVSANLIRISAGLLGLVVFSILRGKLLEDFRRMRDRKALFLISCGSMIGPVLGILFTLYAFTMTPVGIVTTIMQTSPIILLPIDKFYFKKNIPVSAVAGTLVAVGGAVLLFIQS